MCVQALVIPIAPPLRIPLGNLHRKKAAEDRIAGERCRRRQNAKVVRHFDVEELSYQRFEHLPLIQPQAVHDDKQHGPFGFHNRNEKFLTDIHRERRPVCSRIREPLRVVLLHEIAEVLVEALLQRTKGVAKPRLVSRSEAHLPRGKLGNDLDPVAPLHVRRPALFQFAKPLHKILRHVLAAQLRTLYQARYGTQYLPGVHRLHEVIVHLHPDRLAHRARLLTLGDHDQGHRGIDRTNFGHEFEPPLARKLLVQEDHPIGLPLQQCDRVITMGSALDIVPVLFQKEHMCRQRLDFIVHPENRSRTCHVAKLTRCRHGRATRPWRGTNGCSTLTSHVGEHVDREER